MATATKRGVSYKRLLIEAKELRGKVRENAHRLAVILCQLFDDADFRADIGASDDFAVEKFLDDLVGDLRLGFLELRAMLAEFPEQAAWTESNLSTLYAKAEEQIRSRKPERSVPARTMNRVTREQYDALREEKTDAEARLKFVERQNTQAIDELSQLRKENSELREENARLKGRIEQLEKMQSSGRNAA